jgi:hypothetical protein
MNLVYYSIASDGSGRCERQWIQSIRSLRRYNPSIPVHLVVYGSCRQGLFGEAQRHHVTVHMLQNYGVCFRQVPAARHAALHYYRTFHKFHSLRYLPKESGSQVLYADCDTFFFADVARLLERYSSAQWYAREEPWSARSPYGYQSQYIDEDGLASIAHAEDLRSIPPYNTGVCVLNHGLKELLVARSDLLLDYAWRFLVGLRHHRDCPAELARIIRASMTSVDEHRALAYPSGNAWIVEQFATWMVLGSIRSLTHNVFEPADVAQNGEFVKAGRMSRCVLVHYFSNGEQVFFSTLRTKKRSVKNAPFR